MLLLMEVTMEPPAPVGRRRRIQKHHPNQLNSPKSKLNLNRSKSEFILNFIRSESDSNYFGSDWIGFDIRIGIGWIFFSNPNYSKSDRIHPNPKLPTPLVRIEIFKALSIAIAATMSFIFLGDALDLGRY